MWKDKKDVLMISTKSSNSADAIDSGKTDFRNEPIMKPKVVVDYNRKTRYWFIWSTISTLYMPQTIFKMVPKSSIWIDFRDGYSEQLSGVQGTLLNTQYDHPEVSWKSCEIFIAWHAIRGAEAGSMTKGNKSGEAQTYWSQARRERRICTRCPKTVCWLLWEVQTTTIKRNKCDDSKENKNFLSWLWPILLSWLF